jgi:hypothetical protein
MTYLQDAELMIKLASVYLNLGICYIYLNNFNLSEKYLRKGLNQIEGMLGNETVYKVIYLRNNLANRRFKRKSGNYK